MEKLMLIDGHNLLFRMYYGIPSPIMNSVGKDIRGVLGFVGGLLKLANMEEYDKLFIAFDTETSTESRIEEDGNYKKNRVDYSLVPDEENPFIQLDYIYRALDYMNVEYLEVDGYEADDYISSLCKLYGSTHDITIVSTDRDFLQLIDENITLYSPRGKMSIKFTPEEVKMRFDINPDQVIDYKVLVGDSSDNISGVKSIGPKTAVKILGAGTLDEIMNGHVTIEDKLYRKLIENNEMIMKNKRLITMKDDIVIEEHDFSIKFDKNMKTMNILSACGLN